MLSWKNTYVSQRENEKTGDSLMYCSWDIYYLSYGEFCITFSSVLTNFVLQL